MTSNASPGSPPNAAGSAITLDQCQNVHGQPWVRINGNPRHPGHDPAESRYAAIHLGDRRIFVGMMSFVARAVIVGAQQVVADWCWPDKPLVRVRVDGEEVATVDYLPASATAHWFLRWTSQTLAGEGPELLPLLPLVAAVPEEADSDDGFRAAVLDVAIEAVASRLTRPAKSRA